ncbi:MAG: hypothetical protein MJ213_02810, partial [Bacilli bacterium]|nr:hypothetical protein [Bacilli bacterium]
NINLPINYVRRNTATKKAYCPYCGKAYNIPSRGRDYWCPKCFKPLFKTLQDDELSKLSIKDRQNEISLHMADLNMETAPKLLLYANKINTRKIIINLMLKYPLDNKLKDIIESYINAYTRYKITK